jgi:hypothetical protein
MMDEPKASMVEPTNERISLGALLSDTAIMQALGFWIVGDSPLICHAWSHKAKLEMLSKQVGATKTKLARDPEQDFVDSLYKMGEGCYGFPVTGIKKATWACAHKDRGIARTDVQAALWFDAEIVSVRPALAGARCDMPLVRIYGSEPEMREDMGKIGTGMRKTANLIYRAQFTIWAIRVTGNVDPRIVPPHQIAFLVRQAGKAIGLGEWRNEKAGFFGAFHLANPQDEAAWDAFAAGKGPLPQPEYIKQAAE